MDPYREMSESELRELAKAKYTPGGQKALQELERRSADKSAKVSKRRDEVRALATSGISKEEAAAQIAAGEKAYNEGFVAWAKKIGVDISNPIYRAKFEQFYRKQYPKVYHNYAQAQKLKEALPLISATTISGKKEVQKKWDTAEERIRTEEIPQIVNTTQEAPQLEKDTSAAPQVDYKTDPATTAPQIDYKTPTTATTAPQISYTTPTAPTPPTVATPATLPATTAPSTATPVTTPAQTSLPGEAAIQAQQIQDATFRTQQQAIARYLFGQLRGEGPSVAELQLKEGYERAQAGAMSQAASARGISAGAAIRQGLLSQEALAAQAAQETAQLRAQEQLAAKEQLISAITGARGQDSQLDIANLEASMQRQGLNTQLDMANLDAMMKARGLSSQESLANLSARMQQQGINAQMTTANLEAQLRNRQLQQQMEQFYQGMGWDMTKLETGMQYGSYESENERAAQMAIAQQQADAAAERAAAANKANIFTTLLGGLFTLGAGGLAGRN
jgi:hypothetical protein